MNADEIASLIESAAARYGVPPTALMAIANIESGGNIRADNPRSSASGLFQFVDKTAREYGLTGNRRNDPAAQADAAAKMMATNARSLERTLGRPANPGELYLAHQQGLTGATALLSNPNRPAVDVLTAVYGDRSRAQQAVRLNGGKTNQTAGQFAGQWVNKANQRAALVPPGSIPNVVATQLDTQPPPRVQGKAGTPANNRATAAAPTQWFTPRLAPGNTDIYAYRIPEQRNTDLVGGRGSLTPTIGQRDPIPMPRPRPSTAVAGFPTPRPTYQPGPAQRLPELPPSNLASPRAVTASIERANAAVDPGLKRALEQRAAAPAIIDTSMKRAANAVDPALQRALEAATRPAAPSMAKMPTGPALSRDSIAQAALGRDTVQRLGTTPFSPSAPTLAGPVLDPSRIPGPPAVIKTADALPAGVYPAMSPAVATALDVVPSIPLPRLRPAAPVTFPPAIKPVTGFPTAANLRPTAPLLAMTMPTQLGMRPPSYAPLKIAINGANSYSAPSTPTPFQGAATGRTYVPGQQYVMNGQTYSAKQGGGFVNDKTGREVAKGTGWQALHGLN